MHIISCGCLCFLTCQLQPRKNGRLRQNSANNSWRKVSQWCSSRYICAIALHMKLWKRTKNVYEWLCRIKGRSVCWAWQTNSSGIWSISVVPNDDKCTSPRNWSFFSPFLRKKQHKTSQFLSQLAIFSILYTHITRYIYAIYNLNVVACWRREEIYNNIDHIELCGRLWLVEEEKRYTTINARGIYNT